MDINVNSGFWVGADAQHYTDIPLRNFLAEFLLGKKIHTLVDLGCGNADYVKYLLEKGIYCDAYDGNPDTPQLTGNIGKVLDLSEPNVISRMYDCVLSLEVGEHIPVQNEQTFLNNVENCSTYLVILSWAIKGQGGEGHSNEQNNDYIIKEMAKRGFIIDHEESALLREKAEVGWFKNTIMVFYRNGEKQV